jgi:subfamily B ATP-binding cassette protein MsbA
MPLYIKDNLKLVFLYAAPHKKLVALNFIILIFASLFECFGVGMLIPLLETINNQESQNVFTNIIKSFFEFVHIEYTFVTLILIFAALMMCKFTLVALQQHFSRVLSAAISSDLMKKGFNNLMEVPISFFYRAKLGDIVATEFTSSVNSGGLLEYAMMLLRGALFAVTYIIMGCLISAKFTLLLCGIVGLSYILIIPRFRIGYDWGSEEKYIMDEIHSYIYDKLGGIRIIKVFNNEKIHKAAFNNMAVSFKKIMVKIMDNKILTSFSFEPFIFLLIVFSLIIAVKFMTLPMSSILVLLYIFMMLTPQIKLVNANFLHINELLPHFSKIHDLIRRDGKAYITSGSKPINKLIEGICIDNISFSYPNTENTVLKNISLEIPKNKTTAFVGQSGGGKSTLVDLILRHHDPDKGSILVDNQDLRELKIEDWRRLIGFVDQDPYLFNETIRENILYGKPNAGEDELIRAAMMANAHDFILGFPKGYDTAVGNRGITLSGGQKQRIALARALIKDPSILVLDEATSSLDSTSENLIQQSIMELQKTKTMCIIAHRLSTVMKADNIILIEDGRIIEQGTHNSLIRGNGRYKEFCDLQFTNTSFAKG